MYYVHIYDRMNCEICVKDRNSIEKAKNTAKFYCGESPITGRYAECVDEDFNRVFWYEGGKFEW